MDSGDKFFIIVILTIIAVLLLMTFIPILVHMAFAQTNTTPTTANTQNLQFLPQRAYVQTFPPEGAAVQTTSTNDLSLQAIMAAIVLPVAGIVINKFVTDKKVKEEKKEVVQQIAKVENTTKENSAAIVDSKVVAQELARLMFEWNKTKADALNDSPVTKLENLAEETKKATETAVKS